MGRAGCGQAAVCASGCRSEREQYLACRRGVAEALGEGRRDGIDPRLAIATIGRSRICSSSNLVDGWTLSDIFWHALPATDTRSERRQAIRALATSH